MKTDDYLTILFVDDEISVLNSLRRFLRKEPYKTLFATGGEEALQIVKKEAVDIVVTDLRMPGMDGMQLIDRLKTDNPEILRIVLSATRDIEETIASINRGEVFRFISKPLEPESFKKIILNGVDYHLLKRQQQLLIKELGESNKRLESALDTIDQVNSEKEKLQNEAEITEKRIEKQLLQSACPDNLDGISIAATSLPSGHMAGDFFDFITYQTQCFDLVIGDVMGKGLQSALVGAGVKFIILKTLAQHDCHHGVRVNCPSSDAKDSSSLVSAFEQIQKQSIDKLMELEMFVTLCYARFEINKMKMYYLDCGHTKTIHYRASSGTSDFLIGDNLPLGLDRSAVYQPVEINLTEGDLLLFYSDGVTEAENFKGDFFGPESLATLVGENSELPPSELLEKIMYSVQEHTGHNTFSDDFTCIAVKLHSGHSIGD